MLALDDAALARLAIAAAQRPARLPPRAFRSREGHARAASTWYPADQVHHRRRYSMPHLRRPKPDRRRALELLAASHDGATEAIMLAHGFTVEQLVELVRAGLATATAERVVAGGKAMEVARVRITEAGRQALRQGQ